MKTLYLDCGMGAAGDMLAAALLELLPDPDAFIRRLNALGIPGVEIKKERAVKCGIVGTSFSVSIQGAEEGGGAHGHSHEHHHSSMDEIRHLIAGHLDLPAAVADEVMNVYEMIADAESHVHAKPVSEIHFHEVGMMDAIADIAAVCLLMNELAPDEVIVSPVRVGSGHVECAHGILPVPAPATAYLLQGVPIYSGDISGELCTPTGAALLKHFATRFADMPTMAVQQIGYGMGKKDFPAANCVRAMLGETTDRTDSVIELSCNIDDMTGEEIGFATEMLFEGGAYDVYTVPIGMKKSRPGTMLRVLCNPRDRDNLLRLLYRHTSTLGVREVITKRYVLERKSVTVDTPYGEVHVKESSGYGIKRKKYEYEDIVRIAQKEGLSFLEAKARLEKQSDE